MKGPLDDQFEGMAADIASRQRRVDERVSFQGQVVSQVLRHYQLAGEESRLRQLCYDQSGERHLLFSWFLSQHPDFPVWIEARNLPVEVPRKFAERYRLSPRKKTGRPPVLNTRLFRELEEARTQTAAHWVGPVALVFRWWHSPSRRPWKALHTADTPLICWREQVRVETTDGPEVVTLEDLNTFLDGIRWSP